MKTTSELLRHWAKCAAVTEERVSCLTIDQLNRLADYIDAREARISELEDTVFGIKAYIDNTAKSERHTSTPVAVPDGLRLALSNAGIAAPESDEEIWARKDEFIQLLVNWVKDKKPFVVKPATPLTPVSVYLYVSMRDDQWIKAIKAAGGSIEQ